MEARSEQELAIAIQQCYRHVFYPSRNRVGASDVDLAHSAIDMDVLQLSKSGKRAIGRVGRAPSHAAHLEQVVDELNLSPHIRTAHPPRLPLPDHVHGLVALDRSPRRLKLTKSLLGFHASFDRSMILLQDVVQVLDWPVAATASQESFLFHP